ncbi:MAG TPA: PqqD family protein [Oscillatoriaceae cyanobacterium]
MGDRSLSDTQPLEPLPKPHPRVAARVVDGETLILTPADSVLHTLNPVATRIWELLSEHRTLDALVAALTREYDVDRAVAEQDVRNLLTELAEKQIVE